MRVEAVHVDRADEPAPPAPDLVGAFALGLEFSTRANLRLGTAILTVVYGDHPALLAEFRAGVAWRRPGENS